MSTIYEVALETGAELAKKVEDYMQKANEERTMFPYKKKTMEDGAVIFTFTGKWGPYNYEVDKGLIKVLEQYDGYDNDDYAYKLVAVADDDMPTIFCNDNGFEIFGDLCPGVCYPKEWYEDRSEKTFDVALREVPVNKGLDQEDVAGLYDKLKSGIGIPLMLDNPLGNTCAMGFITPEAGAELEWSYKGLAKRVGGILADEGKERDGHTYRYKGLKIWLYRS